MHSEPIEEQHVECETRVTIAGIIINTSSDVAAEVKSSGEDKKMWLAAIRAELGGLLATITASRCEVRPKRTAHPQSRPTWGLS